MSSELPVSSAWISSSGHATKMKENSSGSVMPVRKLVSATESMMPPTAVRFSGFAQR